MFSVCNMQGFSVILYTHVFDISVLVEVSKRQTATVAIQTF
jgi:hypothetical protein